MLGRHALINNVSLVDLRGLKILLPTKEEQRRIAEILDKADALRTKRRAALAQLDTLAQSIFLDMFGDPVTNPKRWNDPKLAGVVKEMQYGPRFYNESYVEHGIRIARITDLSESGELSFDAMPRMLVSDTEASQFALKPGDVIFARSGATVGKVALFTSQDPPCIPGAYFIRIRFKEVIVPEYARAVLCSRTVRKIVEARSRQSAQQNFSGPGLRELPMPVPPIALQLQFVEREVAIKRQRQIFHRSLIELDSLFFSLQHRAFRGEL